MKMQNSVSDFVVIILGWRLQPTMLLQTDAAGGRGLKGQNTHCVIVFISEQVYVENLIVDHFIL